jgi:DNA-binding MarR family transcriptional regulator
MNTLIAKRYIRRRQSKDDRRQQWCSLTDSGRHLIDSVIPRIRATHDRMLNGLRPDEIMRMVELLGRISNPNG